MLGRAYITIYMFNILEELRLEQILDSRISYLLGQTPLRIVIGTEKGPTI